MMDRVSSEKVTLLRKFFYSRAAIIGLVGLMLLVVSIAIPIDKLPASLNSFESFFSVSKDLLNNFGVALISASIALFISHRDFENAINTKNFDDLGIKDYASDYRSFITDGDKLDEFFKSCGRCKEIDIVGIAMDGFIQQNRIIERIEEKSKRGFKVRVIFSDPKSDQVRVQSDIENKKEKLIRDAHDNICEFVTKFGIGDNVNKNVHIYASKSVARFFIIRSGGKMMVTAYLDKGPEHSVSYIYERREIPSAPYNSYLEYIDTLAQYSYSEEELKELMSCSSFS